MVAVAEGPIFSAQEAMVGSLLAEPAWIPYAASRLSPEEVIDERLREIYDAILACHTSDAGADPTLVMERLRERGQLDRVGTAYLSELLDVWAGSEHQFRAHVRAARRSYRHHAFETAVREATRRLDRAEDPEQVWTSLAYELERLGSAYDERRWDDLGAIALQVEASLANDALRGIAWPWTRLSKVAGNLMPGHLWIVSGFSGCGKSAFLRSAAMRLATGGQPVAYFSVEEQGTDVLALMACQLSGASYVRYGTGEALSPEETEAIRLGLSHLKSSKLTLNERKAWVPSALLATVRRYAEEGQARVVVLDHAHLLEYPGKTDRDIDLEVGRFAERLHALAQDVGTTAIVAYQPRKPGEGGDIFRPVAPDEIRGTSRIWNIAENTISPFRPWIQYKPHTHTPVLDDFGQPRIVAPKSKPRENAKEQWVSGIAKEYFFIQPGKARIGGYKDRPVVLDFDSISGAIHE